MTSGSPGPKPLSIFMVVPGRLREGKPLISPFVESQAAALRTAGVEVHIGLFSAQTNPLAIRAEVRRLREECHCSGAALIHVQYGTITALAASFISPRLPLVISFGGSDLFGTPAPGLLWRLREMLGIRCSLWAADRAVALVVKSRGLLDRLPPRLRKKAQIIPNGVDLSLFRPMDKAICRRALGWSEQDPVAVIYAHPGHNRHVKNLPLAQAAIRLAAREATGLRLEVFHSLPPARVAQLLNAADLLLITSLHEGSPNIVKEAMACDLPVVAVPCGDTEERLAGVAPGGVFQYDAGILAEGIVSVFKAGTRSNGREALIRQGLSDSAVAQRLISLYYSALGTP